MDYTKPETIAALVDTVAARTGGRIDALFNNGAYGQPGAVEDLPVEALRAQFETNVFGWHDLTRRVIPFMRPGRGPHRALLFHSRPRALSLSRRLHRFEIRA